jgi:cell shape-determining protein MreC
MERLLLELKDVLEMMGDFKGNSLDEYMQEFFDELKNENELKYAYKTIANNYSKKIIKLENENEKLRNLLTKQGKI